MLRTFPLVAVVLGLLGGGAAGVARAAGDDPRFAANFADGLRTRGYYDLALDYLGEWRQAKETPADFRVLLDFLEGRVLIEAASHDNDPEAARDKLDRARTKIERFVKDQPDHPEATEALIALANLLYERGRTEVIFASEAKTPADKETRLVTARKFFGNARDSFGQAIERLNTKFTAYPKFIPADDPRRLERERVRGSMIQAELQREIVNYDEAETEPTGSPRREELLGHSLTAFEELYKKYRTQMAGLTARMWQGKVFEEQGKLGEAMGIYKELLDHPDPSLRALQRQVDYFRIIVMSKRNEFALAADECNRWLALFPKDRRSYEALGVQTELAKNIIAQLPTLSEADQAKAIRAATDTLADVVRISSPFKPEALTLLQKYRPSAALNAADIAKLSFDDAVTEANQAISGEDYPRAIALLRVALKQVDPTRDLVKANRARMLLGYAFYKSNRFEESAVVDEHIARNDPHGEWSAKAAEVALFALLSSQVNASASTRRSDMDHVADFARHVVATWPDVEQGDTARLALGEVANERGQYADAVVAFDSVRPASARKFDAQAAAGSAHWRQSLALRDKGETKQADAESEKAVNALKTSLKGRKGANVAETEPGYVGAATELATIQVAIDKANDAVALLEPIAAKFPPSGPNKPTNPTANRVITGLLRAHVAAGKVDQAMADMKSLEAAGGSNSAQLYFELGRLLERESEILRERHDTARLARTEQAYAKFLKALVANKDGQTFQSLRWAADNLLKLGSASEAAQVYANLIDFYAKDPEFRKTPSADSLVLTTRIKQVAALRQMGQLNEAESNLNAIIAENKRLLEPQVEKGHILDAKAEAKVGTWADAYAYWRTLAGKLAPMHPKPTDYYDAWYHAAAALQKQGKGDLARQTVASVLRLSPTVGSPEMKTKYQDLLKELSK